MQQTPKRQMCGFDGRCNNPQCSYIHAVQRPNREVCHYGDACSNRACWRFHMCRKPALPKPATVSVQMTPEEAELFSMFLHVRVKDTPSVAEAEMLKMFQNMTLCEASVGSAMDEEVDEAFDEFLDRTDHEQELDDYAADELEALEQLEQD